MVSLRVRRSTYAASMGVSRSKYVYSNMRPPEPFMLCGIAMESIPAARHPSIAPQRSSGLNESSRENGASGASPLRNTTFRCRLL